MNIPVRTHKLIVRTLAATARGGVVQLGMRMMPCAIGRGGIVAAKREGDGGTPRGVLRLVEVRYRADRVRRPYCRLPVRAIGARDGWCDAAGDRNYNRPVQHPYPASAEVLWRDDHVYDLVIVLDYNIRPRVQGRGSAIFMHLARESFAPTAGCVAMREKDLRLLLASCGRRAAVFAGR